MHIAFSTVACPDWTLERVFSFADEVEYDGVELRTFGWGASALTCEPALTDAAKLRRLAAGSGTVLATLATSCRFDALIRPPVLGHLLPGRRVEVETARRCIALADELECPAVRVFAFETHGSERRERATLRIVERLREACDAARARRVRVLLENGGSFPTARDIARVIEQVESPCLGAAYNVAVAHAAGEDPASAPDTLGERMWSVKIKDIRRKTPVEPGTGDVPLRPFVERLARSGYVGWLVVEWVRLWAPELAEPEGVLRRAVDRLREWESVAPASSRLRARS